MKYYMHNVPGRLRIRFPELKYNEEGLNRVVGCLNKHGIINTATITANTGGVLVTYNPAAVDHNDILELLAMEGMIDLSYIISNDAYVEDMVHRAGKFLNKTAASLFLDIALQGTPLSLLTVFI
jgi:hypothetical protein